MTTETKPAKRDEATAVERAPHKTESFYVPEVDVLESADHFRLLADVPGCDPKSIEVKVENNVLTVSAEAHTDVPEGYDLVGLEYRVGRFRREFQVPDEVDADKIRARIQQGVLEVSLPKLSEKKSRRIEISA